MDKWARQRKHQEPTTRAPEARSQSTHQDPKAGRGRHAIDCRSEKNQLHHLVPVTTQPTIPSTNIRQSINEPINKSINPRPLFSKGREQILRKLKLLYECWCLRLKVCLSGIWRTWGQKASSLTQLPKASHPSPTQSPHSQGNPGEAVRQSGKNLKPDHLGSNMKLAIDKTM